MTVFRPLAAARADRRNRLLIRPPQELKAFAKVTLQPGQAQTVSLTLRMRAFAAYDDVRRAWVAEAGGFEVRLGASSADISQRAWVTTPPSSH